MRYLQYKKKRMGGGNRNDGRPNKRSRGRNKDGKGAWTEQFEVSPAFEKYYREQKVCPEEEWDQFKKYLVEHLPMTFRINGSGRFANDLRNKLESDFFSQFSSGPLTLAGEAVNPPKALPWYPDNLAWQLDFSRFHLRRVPHLKELHEFIKRETETGAITRQEAVSMIPPLFLDVKPSHRVLDMCAAPGSKTFQLLESLHKFAGEPSGVVIANDADTMRCNMLTHQSQRMKSPSIMITNHEAQFFPSIKDTDPNSTDTKVLYDRILCDVPCSGDGTVRKQPDIWRKWGSSHGNGLHNIQLRIALRAAELLKVGGRMVYSTCTFNPIEDEAVVAEVLRRTHGCLKIIDMSEKTKDLKFQPGLLTWKAMDRDQWYSSWDQAKNSPKMQESMFPKGDEADFNLPLTMRFLPHHQNTGGFYVAVLEKVKDMPPVMYPSDNQRRKRNVRLEISLEITSDNKVSISIDNNAKKVASHPANDEQDMQKVLPSWGIRGGGIRNAQDKDDKSGVRGKWKGLDPIIPFENQEIISELKSFYGLADDCHILSALVSRTPDEKPKKIVYISPGVKLLLQMDIKESLKVISSGLKMFDRQDSKDGRVYCNYRISQEGLAVILPHLTKQILSVNATEFHALLRDRSITLPQNLRIEVANQVTDKPEREDTKEPSEAPEKPQRMTFTDEKTLADIPNIQIGCCILLLRDDDLRKMNLLDDIDKLEGGLRSSAPFAIPCWRGRSSINVMLAKADCEQMVERLESASAS